MRVAALIAAVMLAQPASAEEVVFDPAPLEACWAQHERSISCLGKGSEPCMKATPYGASNRGMIACLAAELDWWEALVARLLDDLREAETEFDAAPPVSWSEPPSARAGLERTHALWEAWLEARCDYATIEFLGSSMRGLIWASCRLELTASQADFLAQRLGTYANR